MSDELKCPHCGAEIRLTTLMGYFKYQCDSEEASPEERTRLCREREARQKAECERDEAYRLIELHIADLNSEWLGVEANRLQSKLASLKKVAPESKKEKL